MGPLAISRLPSPPSPISGRIVAAIIGPSEESGPSSKIRDRPSTAEPSRHMIEVYRPVIGGRPASSACGKRVPRP